MAHNWLEELVSKYYEIQGYLVTENVIIKMPKTELRSVQGNSDIDVLAIKSNEIVHAECQSWWGPSFSQEKKLFPQLIDRFVVGEKFIFEKFDFLTKFDFQYKRVFITSGKAELFPTKNGPWDRLEYFCSQHQIELLEINFITKKYIDMVKLKYPKKTAHIGKEEGITRFLLHLIHNDFIKITQVDGP